MLQEIDANYYYSKQTENFGTLRPKSYCMLRQHNSSNQLQSYMKSVDALFIKSDTILNSSNQQVLNIDSSRLKSMGILLLKDLQEQALWNIQIISKCCRPSIAKVSFSMT